MKSSPQTKTLKVKRTHPYRDPTIPTQVVCWHGTKDVRVCELGKPVVTEPRDAVVRVTSTTICGSDLHFYNNQVAGMKKGDVIGHEFMGYVDEVGPGVKNFKKGDRVVASFDIACGECEFCKKQAYSCCDLTNPSHKCKELLGDRLCGAYGYTHMTGGYDGGQAEFVRVPIADMNLLKVPDNLPDEKLLFLSDIVCTSWHANELAKVKEGDVVAVWGCGPVGLLTLAWAKFRGASQIVAIDNVDYRLKVARQHLGAITINFDQHDVVDALRDLFPNGPDVAIDAGGFRFPKTFAQKFLFKTGLENDALDIITEMVYAVKKFGRISIVGDYFGCGHAFPIGPFMEKSLTMRGGQTFVQKYWNELLGYIVDGQFDPTFVITHHFSLEDAPTAFKLMNNHEDKFIKCILHVDWEDIPRQSFGMGRVSSKQYKEQWKQKQRGQWGQQSGLSGQQSGLSGQQSGLSGQQSGQQSGKQQWGQKQGGQWEESGLSGQPSGLSGQQPGFSQQSGKQQWGQKQGEQWEEQSGLSGQQSGFSQQSGLSGQQSGFSGQQSGLSGQQQHPQSSSASSSSQGKSGSTSKTTSSV